MTAKTFIVDSPYGKVCLYFRCRRVTSSDKPLWPYLYVYPHPTSSFEFSWALEYPSLINSSAIKVTTRMGKEVVDEHLTKTIFKSIKKEISNFIKENQEEVEEEIKKVASIELREIKGLIQHSLIRLEREQALLKSYLQEQEAIMNLLTG